MDTNTTSVITTPFSSSKEVLIVRDEDDSIGGNVEFRALADSKNDLETPVMTPNTSRHLEQVYKQSLVIDSMDSAFVEQQQLAVLPAHHRNEDERNPLFANLRQPAFHPSFMQEQWGRLFHTAPGTSSLENFFFSPTCLAISPSLSAPHQQMREGLAPKPRRISIDSSTSTTMVPVHKMKKLDMRDLLRRNGQHVGGSKLELEQRVLDGRLYGRLGKCKCPMGRLKLVENNRVICKTMGKAMECPIQYDCPADEAARVGPWIE